MTGKSPLEPIKYSCFSSFSLMSPRSFASSPVSSYLGLAPSCPAPQDATLAGGSSGCLLSASHMLPNSSSSSSSYSDTDGRLSPGVTVTLAVTRFAPGSADCDDDYDGRRVSEANIKIS